MHIIDAKDKILGRVATEAAHILRGKNSSAFEPHAMPHQKVIIKNISLIRVTGGKEKTKVYKGFSGYPGGLKETSYRLMFIKDPKKVMEHAVRGMLPKNTVGRHVLRKNLVMYKGDVH